MYYCLITGRMTENAEYIAPSTPDMLEDVKVVTFESAQHYFLVVSDAGQVYSWGENSGGTCQVSMPVSYESGRVSTVIISYSWVMRRTQFSEFQN